jgi:hypothetical protein
VDFLLAIADEVPRSEFRISTPQIVVGCVSALVVLVCVVLHYEVMSWSSRLWLRFHLRRRVRVLALIATMFVAHLVEIWIFALVYWHLDQWPQLGRIVGPFEEGALDFVYFSVTAFTTLGFGDLVPQGAVRILVGTEALLGLSLITWTASFAFLEMQRDWAEFRRPSS